MENQPDENSRSRSENTGPFVRRKWRVYQYVPKRDFGDQYIPPHLSHLFDAIERIGQHYVQGWTGEERAARGAFSKPVSPLDVETEHPEQGRVFLDDGTSKWVPLVRASEWWLLNKDALFQEWEAETAAFKRWQEAENRLRDIASSGELPGFGMLRGGQLKEIPASSWISVNFQRYCRDGFENFDGYQEGDTEQGIIVFQKHDLPGELSGDCPFDATGGIYLDKQFFEQFPYLYSMIECASEFRDQAGNRILKKELIHRLAENRPSHLPPFSQAELSNMASLLRRPEHKRGGLRKQSS